MFNRMKSAMAKHITHKKKYMFRAAADHVQAQLDKVCEETCKEFKEQTSSTLDQIKSDYQMALVNELRAPRENAAKVEDAELKHAVDKRLPNSRRGTEAADLD